MDAITVCLIIGLVGGVIAYAATANPSEREIEQAREQLLQEMPR